MRDKIIRNIFILSLSISLTAIQGCDKKSTPSEEKSVPHEGRYGIYALNLSTQDVSLIYGSEFEIYTSALRPNSRGDTLVFAQKIDCTNDTCVEICAVAVGGGGFRRITTNNFWDLYPVWSPDGSRIAFLSRRDADLDIYVMSADGSGVTKLYDSGDNDADIDWRDNAIVFTTGCRIWKVNSEGANPTGLTNPPKVCQWGNANLPFGDYDPRFSYDGSKIVFERLVDDASQHGNYDLYLINTDGSGETRLTNTGYSQGLASWSHSGDKIIFTVSAINNAGKYRLYMINADGTNNRDITPTYFPAAFLCHSAIFSQDDAKVYFIGEWWQ